MWPPDLVREFTPNYPSCQPGRGWRVHRDRHQRDLPAQRRLAHRLPEADRAPRRTRWSWRGRAGAGLDAMELAWTRSLARRARTSCEFPGPADSSGSRRTSAPQTSSSRPRISPNSTARCRAHQRVTPLHARHRDRDDLPTCGSWWRRECSRSRWGITWSWVSSCPPSGEQQTVVFARRS